MTSLACGLEQRDPAGLPSEGTSSPFPPALCMSNHSRNCTSIPFGLTWEVTKMSSTHPTEWHRLQNRLLGGVYALMGRSHRPHCPGSSCSSVCTKAALHQAPLLFTGKPGRPSWYPLALPISGTRELAGAPTFLVTQRPCGCPLMSLVSLTPQATCRGLRK